MTVGAIGAVINTLSLYLLVEYIAIHYILASFVSIELAIIIQFILNDNWTFKERKSGHFITKLLKTNIVRTFGIILNMSILFILTEYAGIFYLISNGIAIISVFIVNYILENKYTFIGVRYENSKTKT